MDKVKRVLLIITAALAVMIAFLVICPGAAEKVKEYALQGLVYDIDDFTGEYKNHNDAYATVEAGEDGMVNVTIRFEGHVSGYSYTYFEWKITGKFDPYDAVLEYDSFERTVGTSEGADTGRIDGSGQLEFSRENGVSVFDMDPGIFTDENKWYIPEEARDRTLHTFERTADAKYDLNDFAGTYYSDDKTAIVNVDKNDTATVEIRQIKSENEWVTWVMHGTLNSQTAILEYSDCQKTLYTDNYAQQKEIDKETLYSDREGSIVFDRENNNSSFTWKDAEEAGDHATFLLTESLRPEMVTGIWVKISGGHLGEKAAGAIALREDGTALGYGLSEETYMPVPVFEGTWSIDNDRIRMDYDGETHYFTVDWTDSGLPFFNTGYARLYQQ